MINRQRIKCCTIFNFKSLQIYKVVILSHESGFDSRSPKKPAFKEALLVQLIKLIDSQLNLMDKSLNEDSELGEFTNHYNYFKTHLFKGKDGTK